MTTATKHSALKMGLLNELKHEAATTRKILAAVPADKKTYKPHEKSMVLEGLAKHIAELPTWVTVTLKQDVLDFAKPYPKAPEFTTTEALLARFDHNIAEAIDTLENINEEEFFKDWTMRNGEKVFFTLPKVAVLRNMVYNHTVHHRAQLGVYLRLLEIPLPNSYGPTADFPMM
ncbi:MAG TPA: DinB family protein [Bacteroidia bacterium]|nr:DinB family protein [Bacteroidia bacterium]